ncbi:MAG: hypothetical protein GWN86_08625 [Desulfobacterales bacterium]|nr:hypothetical protein [Desulfobacterales bacterium]
MKKNNGWHNFLLRLAPLWLIPCLFLTSCSAKDDADIIRQVIKEGAELAAEHDAIGLMQFTTEDFLAGPGQHDRKEVRRILWLAFRHYGQFKIVYPEPSIDVESNSDEAFAKVYFLIVRREGSLPQLEDLYKDPQRWLQEVGESADLYRLTLDFLKKDGDWLVRRSLLEPYKGLGFGA